MTCDVGLTQRQSTVVGRDTGVGSNIEPLLAKPIDAESGEECVLKDPTAQDHGSDSSVGSRGDGKPFDHLGHSLMESSSDDPCAKPSANVVDDGSEDRTRLHGSVVIDGKTVGAFDGVGAE